VIGGQVDPNKSTSVTTGKKIAVVGLSVFGLGVLGILWALFGVELGLLPPLQPTSLFAVSGGFVGVGLITYIIGRVAHWYKTG
jgi:hypothetical protein